MRRGAPAILPPKLDFSVLSFSPKDLLLLEAQQWDAKVIAAMYGTPLHMLNMALEGRSSLTYNNPAQIGEQWWRFELRPTALKLSRALSEQMLPRGSQVDFDATDTFSPLAQPLEQDSLAEPATAGQADEGDVVPLRPTVVEGF
jgi:phage portal protein BeeE